MLGAYHAAKYGVVGLSEALVMELAGTGVGVSCLCPELVATRIFESTRNAPAHLGLPPARPVSMEMIEGLLKTTALDPGIVAGNVVDAITEGKFWVLTHESTRLRVQHRNGNLENGETPEMLVIGDEL
jgi:short-subunit dehydrogenase